MTLPSFQFALPGRVVFGRNEAQKAPALIRAMGARGVLVHGADPSRAGWLLAALREAGGEVRTIACPAEPTLPMLEAALDALRGWDAEWVVALGGGAALDMGKALAALIPAPGGIMDHLEVVGLGLPLKVAPQNWSRTSTLKVTLTLKRKRLAQLKKTKPLTRNTLGPGIHNPAHRICDQDQQPGC